MKKKWVSTIMCVLVVVASLSFASPVYGQQTPCKTSIPPVVSTDWLEANADLKNLVILDIRGGADYEAGHIANAINVPFEAPYSAWITMRDDLLLELPDKDELFDTIGSLGITRRSPVVIVPVGPADPPYPLAQATRAADTLIYAGVKNVAILDGGHAKWVAEGKPTTAEVPEVTPVTYRSYVKRGMFVSIEYVHWRINRKHRKPILIDARDEIVYTGVITEPYAAKPGHIPTAKSLPTVLIWDEDGLYKSKDELEELASAVVGVHKHKEIIIYCGVGGYASSWWFVLVEMLGYRNVKIYDGSAQEWVRYYDMVLD